MRNAYKALIGKPEQKTPLGKSRHRWKDNIAVDLKETGRGFIWLRIRPSGTF
jgi:hypothetical protein